MNNSAVNVEIPNGPKDLLCDCGSTGLTQTRSRNDLEQLTGLFDQL